MSAIAPIELTELGDPIEVTMTTDQARVLAASEVVSVVPTLDRPGRWFVGPARKVGAARIGDLTVRITPKVKIARLLFLLGYSVHGSRMAALGRRPRDGR